MKIAITGANGFIGSYLANYFLRNGMEVIAISKGFHPSVKPLLQQAKLVELDVLNVTQVQDLKFDADVIIHTATANDIISKDTLKGIELSVLGTKNVFELAIKNKIQKCIIFSTLQVYGIELTGTITEASPVLSQNDYGMNHLFAEMYAEMYSRQGKLNCVSVRPSNVYGRILSDAFNRWSLVPGCFCKEAVESGTITIKSSGKQMRNFVSLENLSIAVHAIAGNFPKQYECYNLVSSVSYTMGEVAEITKKVYEAKFKKELKINVTGSEPAQTNYFKTPLDKLNNIGFAEDQKFNLESEITEIFNYLTTKKQ
jgi:UDP-glucose 4-epimerase